MNAFILLFVHVNNGPKAEFWNLSEVTVPASMKKTSYNSWKVGT